MEPHKMREKGSGNAPGAFSLLGTASTMGLHMVSGPVVGGGLGWLIDHWLDSWPIGASIGLVLGLAAGFRNVWVDARYLERSNAAIDEERRRQEENVPSAGNNSLKKNGKVQKIRESSIEKERVRETAPEQETGPVENSLTASILAGTASAREGDLEELDETLEAIRRVLKSDDPSGAAAGGMSEKGENA